MQDYAPIVFEHHQSVLNAGVLFAIPALISQGLNAFFKVFKPLPAGFYGLHHIVLMLCFMALCRIKNPEQLKRHSPGELGKLLGLDRIPEVGYFRKKLKQITDQYKLDDLHTELFHSWVEEMPEMFFYIDGHVMVYHGEQANLPKRFVSREKLCLSGTTEFWVNDLKGRPLMVVTAELNEKLKTAIEEIIPKIMKETTTITKLPSEPIFTIVFDREAYEPVWFKQLWNDYRVAVITYRKNVKDNWDEKLFQSTEVQLNNTNVTMQLCEMGVRLNELWFREIRKLSDSGHQTSIMTTHPSLSMQNTASKMFSRWTQENFFKYMIKEFDFDRMIEYGTEEINQKRTIPNPEYKTLTYQIKKSREKKSRLEARVFQKLENDDKTVIDNFAQILIESSPLIEKINEYNNEIKKLIANRKKQTARISIAQMPKEQRYNKLKTESKKLKNAVIMVAYRAETALYNIMSELYTSNQQEGRVILNEIFTSDADIIPDYENKKLTVRLHSLSTPRANIAVKELCTLLTLTESRYPTTDLTMVYETLAV